MKWGYLLHSMLETYTVSTSLTFLEHSHSHPVMPDDCLPLLVSSTESIMLHCNVFQANQSRKKQQQQQPFIFFPILGEGETSGIITCSSNQIVFIFVIGQMVVAKALSRLYADTLLYGQSIVYNEHCVSVSRELKDKRLEGEHLEILSSLYLSLNTERSVCASHCKYLSILCFCETISSHNCELQIIAQISGLLEAESEDFY